MIGKKGLKADIVLVSHISYWSFQCQNLYLE